MTSLLPKTSVPKRSQWQAGTWEDDGNIRDRIIEGKGRVFIRWVSFASLQHLFS